jgi:hypothetical protein
MERKYLFLGLGGGLDIVSTAVLYLAAKKSGLSCELGELRQFDRNVLIGGEDLTEGIVKITPDVQFRGEQRPRFAGALVAEHLNMAPWLILTYRPDHSNDPSNLLELGPHPPTAARRLQRLIDYLGITDLILLDSGGDSLIFGEDDGTDIKTPWGDHGPLLSLMLFDEIPVSKYLAIVAAPEDIKPEAFHRNVEMIKAQGGFRGKVNLFRKDFSDWPEDLFVWDTEPIGQFTALCEKILVLDPNHKEQIQQGRRQNSTMATSFYYATIGKFGLQPVFERKGVLRMDDEVTPAVRVRETHADIWLFDSQIVCREVLRYHLGLLGIEHEKIKETRP